MEAIAQGNFNGWAIVEMMGHRKEIGFVTTEAFGPAALFRVDQPERPAREYELKRPEWIPAAGHLPAGSKVQREAAPARTCYVAPSAIYALNPCNEAAALEALELQYPRPVSLIERGAVAELPAAEEGDF